MEAHLVRLNQDLVLDITQDRTSQDSRTFKLQKGEFKLCEAWPIKNCSKSNSTKFKSGSSPRKRLRFQSNTYKYKRKILTTFSRILKDLWVTPMRSWGSVTF